MQQGENFENIVERREINNFAPADCIEEETEKKKMRRKTREEEEA